MSTTEPIPVHKTLSTYGPGNFEFLDGKESDDGDGSKISTLRSLVKPFVIKQYLYDGKIYRERAERVPSRFELFFDLVFVAVAHQLSEAAAEHASGVGLALFILTFFPVYSLWNEGRAFVNHSGTDDFLQRYTILFLMLIIVGYTANASAISIGFAPEPEAGAESATHLAISGLFMGAAEEPSTTSTPTTEAASIPERDPALVAATGFFLVGRGMRIIFFLIYAYALPHFRSALLWACFNQSIVFVVYFPLLFVRSIPAIIALASVGMGMDLFARYSIGLHRLNLRAKARPSEDVEAAQKETPGAPGVADETAMVDATATGKQAIANYIPALNIEHFLERTSAFVIIVLGEMVLGLVYHASSSTVGIQSVFLNAFCGLLIAFNFAWLYFDAECSHRFVHALRRNWFTGLSFTAFHFPLYTSLILAGGAMPRMTQNEAAVTPAIRWYFCGGLGVAMLSMAGIGFLHRQIEPTGTTRLGRRTQLGFRIAVGIIIVCLPLASNLSPVQLLGISAGVTSFLVMEETYGKLLRHEEISKMNANEEDEAAAHQRRADDVVEVDQEEDEYGLADDAQSAHRKNK